MKTISIFVTSLVIGTMLFITSCDRQSAIVVDPDGSRQGIAPISVVDGRLKFADSQTFGKTLGELYKNANFDEWEKQFKGFTSVRTAYKRVDMEEIASNPASLKAVEAIVRKESSPTDGDSYDRSIVDPLLAAIVSDKGLLQVGDSLYKIRDDQVRMTHVKYADEIDNPASSHVLVKVPSKFRTTKGGRVASITEVDDYYNVPYYFDGREHRYKSNGWALRYGFQNYRSAGVRVNHQRKGTFGWSWSNAFDWTASGYWYITTTATPPIALVSIPTLSVSLSYETDEFVPYYYYESPYSDGALVNAYCSWHSTGRDGLDHYYAHYIYTTF